MAHLSAFCLAQNGIHLQNLNGGKTKAKNWKSPLDSITLHWQCTACIDSDASVSSTKNPGSPLNKEKVLSWLLSKHFGDRFCLRQAVLEKFSDGDLVEAMQVLWDHCCDGLEKLRVQYVCIPVAPPQVLFPSCLILHTKTGWYIDVPLIRDLCFMLSLWILLMHLINWILIIQSL